MNEFEIIKKYLRPLSTKSLGSYKLTDDIFFDSKKKFGISIDTYVEGVHFKESSDPNKFLKKVLRASLSDLYCKGLKPKIYFLSFALNKKFVNPLWLQKIKKNIKK